MPSPVLSLLREHYPIIAKDLWRPLLDVLSAGRVACDGDLEKFYVLLVVAMRTLEDPRFAGLSLADVLSGEVRHYPSLTTNIRSISDSTGIPKETVRRKVTALVEDGWIARVDNHLSFTPHASRMLTEVREPILAFAAAAHGMVEALQATAARAAPDR